MTAAIQSRPMEPVEDVKGLFRIPPMRVKARDGSATGSRTPCLRKAAVRGRRSGSEQVSFVGDQGANVDGIIWPVRALRRQSSGQASASVGRICTRSRGLTNDIKG